jgi:hypothetical protein
LRDPRGDRSGQTHFRGEFLCSAQGAARRLCRRSGDWLVVGLTLGLHNGGDDGFNYNSWPTASPTATAPSAVPSAALSAALSAAPSAFAIERFQQEILPEYSQIAIQETTSLLRVRRSTGWQTTLRWTATGTSSDFSGFLSFTMLQVARTGWIVMAGCPTISSAADQLGILERHALQVNTSNTDKLFSYSRVSSSISEH